MSVCKVTVRSIINRAARRGRPTTYGQLTEAAGGSRRNRGDLKGTTDELKVSAAEDLAAGKPVRASLAVNARSGQPGPAFFEQVEQAGRKVGPDPARFAANEAAECAAYYGHTRSRRTR